MCQRVIIITILCIPLCVGFIINLLTTLPVLLLDLNVEGTVRERDNATDTKNYVKNHVFMMYMYSIPYSQKYWRELNLVVEPKITIARILVDLNLAVRYGIAIHII